MKALSFGGFLGRRWRLLLLEGLICLAVLSELTVDVLGICRVLHLILLDEAFDEVVEVIVEPPHLVLHVLLEGDSPDLYLVDKASEHS